MNNVSDKSCVENQNFMLNINIYIENHSVYEIM